MVKGVKKDKCKFCFFFFTVQHIFQPFDFVVLSSDILTLLTVRERIFMLLPIYEQKKKKKRQWFSLKFQF